MPVSIIDDGFAVDGVLNACEQHDEVNFKYRPANESEFSRYTRKCEQEGRKAIPPPGKPDPVAMVTANLIAEHVVEWDIVNPKGETIEPTVDNAAKLPTMVSVKMVEAILTSASSGAMQEQVKN